MDPLKIETWMCILYYLILGQEFKHCAVRTELELRYIFSNPGFAILDISRGTYVGASKVSYRCAITWISCVVFYSVQCPGRGEFEFHFAIVKLRR